ncbi:hypothetical protein F4778DRAFT_775676 [Xylariomycetidae sp. FL2044]|nr:hypothetical protein F4778DRAFT_775676 [Xylariomycetidae sp. FL2044]
MLIPHASTVAAVAVLTGSAFPSLSTAEPVPPLRVSGRQDTDMWCCMSGCSFCSSDCRQGPCTFPYPSCCAVARKTINADGVLEFFTEQGQKMTFVNATDEVA